MEDKEEIFKDIEGYEGLYQISNYGRVKSLERLVYNNGVTQRVLKEKILINSKTNSKVNIRNYYYKVTLTKNCKSKTFLLHRLIAHHFIQPIFNTNLVVNHIDSNGLNNDLSNIEVTTYKLNTLHYQNSENRKIDVKKRYKKIYQYDLNGNFIKEWENSNIAIKSGYSRHICSVLLGKRNKSGNSFWSYTKLQ